MFWNFLRSWKFCTLTQWLTFAPHHLSSRSAARRIGSQATFIKKEPTNDVDDDDNNCCCCWFCCLCCFAGKSFHYPLSTIRYYLLLSPVVRSHRLSASESSSGDRQLEFLFKTLTDFATCYCRCFSHLCSIFLSLTFGHVGWSRWICFALLCFASVSLFYLASSKQPNTRLAC